MSIQSKVSIVFDKCFYLHFIIQDNNTTLWNVYICWNSIHKRIVKLLLKLENPCHDKWPHNPLNCCIRFSKMLPMFSANNFVFLSFFDEILVWFKVQTKISNNSNTKREYARKTYKSMSCFSRRQTIVHFQNRFLTDKLGNYTLINEQSWMKFWLPFQ